MEPASIQVRGTGVCLYFNVASSIGGLAPMLCSLAGALPPLRATVLRVSAGNRRPLMPLIRSHDSVLCKVGRSQTEAGQHLFHAGWRKGGGGSPPVSAVLGPHHEGSGMGSGREVEGAVV